MRGTLRRPSSSIQALFEAERVAHLRLATTVAWLSLTMNVGFSALHVALSSWSSAAVGAVGVLGSALALGLRRTRLPPVTGIHVVLAADAVVVAVVAWRTGGSTAPVLVWLLLAPLAPFYAGQRWTALVWGAIAAAIGAAFAAAEAAGVVFPQDLSETALLVMRSSAWVAFIAALSGLVFLMESQHDAVRRQLVETNGALAEARDRALSASHAKSDFIASISHDLRTPLHAVLAWSRLIEERLEPGDRKLSRSTRAAATSLLGLVEDLLDAGRHEAGSTPPPPLPFRFGAVIDDVAEVLRMQANEKGIEVVTHVDAALFDETVMGHAHSLRRALTNLVANAVKFTDRGIVVLSAVRVDDSEVRIDVADSGVGIDAADHARIFQRFEQVGDARGGLGLGLAIVADLVRQQGGRIDLESAPGKGARFTLRLPLARRPAPAPHERPPHVLVAEDNPVSQKLAALMLESFGCEVVVVADGLEAVERAATETFDVVFMDCHMPRLSGFDAARRIRAAEQASTASTAAPRVAIIALTASAADEVRDRCVEAGMDGFLSKPVGPAELRAAVERWMQRTTDPPQAAARAS